MKGEDRLRTSLHEKIDQLTARGVDVVWSFVDAVLTPLHSESLPPTWLTTAAWKDAFTAWLQGYHALSTEPLGTLQFEAAFNHACEAAGWNVAPAASATQRFFDTTINNGEGVEKNLSLKASSAKEMRLDKVHISKLTEGAWIQDARRQAERRDRIIQLFQDYQQITSSIFMLRGFRGREGYQVFYELVEIPTTLFSQMVGLTVAQAQLGTINIPPGSKTRGKTDSRNFAITIDRSDAKITLTGIRLDECIIHGRWGLE
jgi:Type II site-specific deoxyribonuclease